MNKDKWRLVLHCLHADKLPPGLDEKQKRRYNEAFAIIKGLKSFIVE